jgi:hypothetical protein
MPRIMNQISLFGVYCTDLHAGSDANGFRDYRLRQKNASVPFDPTSSGECEFMLAVLQLSRTSFVGTIYPGPVYLSGSGTASGTSTALRKVLFHAPLQVNLGNVGLIPRTTALLIGHAHRKVFACASSGQFCSHP